MKVFLIHGMGRTRVSLLLLRRRLSQGGFDPRIFGYSVVRPTLSTVVDRLVAEVAAGLGVDEPYGIVAHSLGNVIARAASPRLPRGLVRLVMLAPPNQPPVLARKLARNPIFKIFTGDAGQRLGSPDFYSTLPVPAVPTLVLAGTGGPRARWLPLGREPSDGLVTVAETRLPGAEHREVRCLHTFIMNNAKVTKQVVQFLAVRAADRA